MVDKTPGDRKLSVPNKTLTLKPRVETGTVKQSFSHGRTKQVVVEKRGKRRVGGEAPAAETHAPEPTLTKSAPAAPAKAPLARPATPAAPDPSRRRRRGPSCGRPDGHGETGATGAARSPDPVHRAQCRRRARALDCLVSPPHPASQGTCVKRAKGKAGSRGGDPGSDQHPGTRKPDV